MDFATLTEHPSENSPPLRNDFFKPLNEMDPMIKQPEATYDFQCKLFNMNDSGHVMAYKEIVNKCLTKEAVMGIKQTHFTKEGDMMIYLEWMMVIPPKKITAEVPAAKPTKEDAEAQKLKLAEQAKVDAKAKKQQKKSKKDHITNEPTLPLDLTDSLTMKFEDL